MISVLLLGLGTETLTDSAIRACGPFVIKRIRSDTRKTRANS